MAHPTHTGRSDSASVALVTGASRGVGRGVAGELHRLGMTVYATGRSIEQASLPEGVVRIACDHLHDAQTARVFDRIAAEAGRLDMLVNSAWGGYETMIEHGEFTWAAPFWEQSPHRWTAMMDAGVRAAFVASHTPRD